MFEVTGGNNCFNGPIFLDKNYRNQLSWFFQKSLIDVASASPRQVERGCKDCRGLKSISSSRLYFTRLSSSIDLEYFECKNNIIMMVFLLLWWCLEVLTWGTVQHNCFLILRRIAGITMSSCYYIGITMSI